MSFLQKLRAGIAKFMAGRRGADELSLALLIAGVILSFLSSLTRIGLFYLIGLVAYGLSLFRMFSRNIEKRYGENAKFLTFWRGWRSNLKQFINRVKNMKKYKYFKCPGCGTWLRVPRRKGKIHINCRCGYTLYRRT